MTAGKIKYVLFDMDGVLVDSEPIIREAAVEALREYGVEASPGDFKPFVGAGDDRYIGGAAEKHGLTYAAGMKTRLYEIYLELAPKKLRVFPGAPRLLSRLKDEGFILALATSADRVKADANLKAAKISETLFSCVVTGEDVAEKKPSPGIYLKAAAKLGASPSECVVVEDALNGAAAARSAGMVCIGVATSFSREELAEAGADFICGGSDEVYGIIAGIKEKPERRG